ncbi:hypothetical protein J6590_097245, partial [Homalodisca vitripennis]
KAAGLLCDNNALLECYLVVQSSLAPSSSWQWLPLQPLYSCILSGRDKQSCGKVAAKQQSSRAIV